MKDRARISILQTQRLALNTGLLASIRVLQSDAAGLTRYLEEQAAENPALLLQAPVPSDWTPRWRSAFAAAAGNGTGAGGAEMVAAPGPSLMAHVVQGVAGLRLSAREGLIADALAGALEPTGWLGRPLAEIAAATGATLAEAEAVLARLQRLDPPGLFARTLAECLRLQAEEAGLLDPAMVAVLSRLALLAEGDPARLARAAGLPLAEVQRCIGIIRGFDPKPGARFDSFAAPVREPDLLVEPAEEGGWQVALNRSALPALSVGEGEGAAAARAILRAVEGRNATLLRVAREILSRQRAALDHGLGALVPMTMAEVAQATGLAQSTISRVVAGAAVDTPRGTIWLRALFSAALGEGGEAVAAVKDRLARAVASEDPARPLSDAALAALLAEGGAAPARRTVAKYRAMLGIPPASVRRRAKRRGKVAPGPARRPKSH